MSLPSNSIYILYILYIISISAWDRCLTLRNAIKLSHAKTHPIYRMECFTVTCFVRHLLLAFVYFSCEFYVHTCSRDLEATLSMHHTSHRSMIRQSDTLFLLNLFHKSIDFHEVREYYTS